VRCSNRRFITHFVTRPCSFVCDELHLKEQTEAVKATETKGPSKFQRPHSTPSAPVANSNTNPSASVSDPGNAVAPLPLDSTVSEGIVTKSAEGSGHAAALQSSSSQPWAASNVSRDVMRRANSLDSHVASASLQQVTHAGTAAAEEKNARLRAQIDQILDEIEQKDKEIAGSFERAPAAFAPPSHDAVFV
jgi:hypothetical protein